MRIFVNKKASCLIALLLCLFSIAVRQASAAQAGPIIVQTKFGGSILGYDVDQNGTEGLLSEFVTLVDGNFLIATETFSQQTGAIIKVIAKENNTSSDDFVTQGIFGNSVGLDAFLHTHINHFLTLNPLDTNKFTGVWTPPIKNNYELWEISRNQGVPNVAAMQVSFVSGPSYLFSSNIAANSFGSMISLEPISQDFFIPLIALDAKANTAVLAQTEICANCTPEMAEVNLTTGKMREFEGIGVGSAAGLAVDSNTGIACTTTTIDQNVEFYDLAKETGFLVHLPGASSEIQSGQDVEVDSIHGLFLVDQYTSTGDINNPQPRIYVYDEQGNLQNTVGGLLPIPISGAYIALNPHTRTGFVPVVTSESVNELQSFTY